MADLWNIQTNLNRGELSPLLVGRVDLQAYYAGTSVALNVLSIPQGGMRKRPGTVFLGESFGDGRLENFSFNVDQNYLLVFTALRLQIYKNGVLQTNINGSGNDWLDIPYTLEQIRDFDYIQSADTIIITHEDVATQLIQRTSDTDWSITTLPFSNIPQFDFNDAASPTPTSEIQQITFTNSNNGDRFKLSLNGILTDEIVYSQAVAAGNAAGLTTASAIQKELQRHPLTGATGVTVINSPAANQYTITFADDSANNWALLGVTFISSKSVDAEGITSRIQEGVPRREDSWSATRGWPRTCTFHEGRLWLGGSKSRPNTVWGSRVGGDFYNFDKGRSFDDESIEGTLDTDQINAIAAIFSNRSLQIFTAGGEFYVPESPITPENVAFSPQTNMGSKRVRPVTIDGVTLFVQRTGKAIVQFVFVDEFKSNQSGSISFMSEHLIKNTTKMSVRRGTDGQDANYIFMNNSDGTVTVFNTLSTEEVAGFTRWETATDLSGDGNIRSLAVVDSKVNLLTRRTINGATVYYIEQEDESLFLDCSVLDLTPSSDTITGLNHLEGEKVHARADGAYMGEFTVSGGQIVIQREANRKEVGLLYLPEIKTMPLNVQAQNGPNASAKKKIARISVQLYESNGVLVNGQRIYDKTIGQDQFDSPSPNTGIFRKHVLGWSLEAYVTITQTTPMPLTLLNIGMEVKL